MKYNKIYLFIFIVIKYWNSDEDTFFVRNISQILEKLYNIKLYRYTIIYKWTVNWTDFYDVVSWNASSERFWSIYKVFNKSNLI